MGILYWNIINTLILKTKEPTLYFSIPIKQGRQEKYDIMYSLPITYFRFNNYIIFKNNARDFLKSFIINIDGVEKIINIDSLPKNNIVIKYCDNKDKPFRNNNKMKHTPFIISNNMYKLPETNNLKFVKSEDDIRLELKNESYTHGGYNGITIFHNEIRTINNEFFKNKNNILDFKQNYERYLINDKNIKLEDEYKFMLKYV